jgi:branched-chain amino acid transport system ATP-binding protein
MTAPAIEIDRLSKHFGGLRAVDDVSLSVGPGERRVLIGPNGAGKTTLFNCIAGTLKPSGGRVLLFGSDIPASPRTAAQHSAWPGLSRSRMFARISPSTRT